MGRRDTYFGDCKSPYSRPADCKSAGTGGEKAYRGQTMMHEVTESYIGGLNALKTGKPTGNASVSRQEFEEAHKAATLQPVLPDIKQILEEFRTRRGK